MAPKSAPRNRTLKLTAADRRRYHPLLRRLERPVGVEDVVDTVIHQDLREALPHLPHGSVDLLVLDPPYNRTKQFSETEFKRRPDELYESWWNGWMDRVLPLLKPTASVYVCGDWRMSGQLLRLCERHFHVRNRITWEREKGRGAIRNWKNNAEDIWFCTVTSNFYFDVNAVKLRRRVIAPYRNPDGSPRDWEHGTAGRFRDTHPSNVWTDITVPFWSMPENTDHPTQKPEKLMAKLILASSRPGDMVLDPFAGSGTTAVAARKLGRRFIAIEREEEYALTVLKRLELARSTPSIQGYEAGLFWDRNASK